MALLGFVLLVLLRFFSPDANHSLQDVQYLKPWRYRWVSDSRRRRGVVVVGIFDRILVPAAALLPFRAKKLFFVPLSHVGNTRIET
jgi:hypothetical protein